MRIDDDIREKVWAVFGLDLDDESIAAFKKKWANPADGRLIYLPWSAGSKCIPEFQGDEDGHDSGGRC